ncbi:MAG: cellulose synthase, partial [Kovacikia sp.]
MNLSVQRDRLANWLVDDLPSLFDHILQGLSRRHLVILMGALIWLFLPLITTRLAIWQQGILTVVLMTTGLILVRLEEKKNNSRASESLHLILMMLSLIVTTRYLYYRANYTLNFDSWIDTFFCLLLFSAELYAILT